MIGPRGVGKSICLNQMVMHARKQGWLCMFIPNGWDHTQGGWYVEPISKPCLKKGEEEDIIVGKTIYNNVIMSAEALRGFWKAHHSMLKDILLRNPEVIHKYDQHIAKFKETWSREAIVPGRKGFGFFKMRAIIEGEENSSEQDDLDEEIVRNFDAFNFVPRTLEDLVVLGVAYRDLAGLVFLDVMAELKQIESVPVLLAVDQYNAWEVPSSYAYHEEKEIQGWQIAVPSTLHFIAKKKAETESWSMKNGICVCATSFKHTEGRKEGFDKVKNSIPLVIEVPSYSQAEFLSAVLYYQKQDIIYDKATVQELLTYRTYSGSNPKQVKNMAVGFFLNLAMDKESVDPYENDDGASAREGYGNVGAVRSFRGSGGDDSNGSIADSLIRRASPVNR